MRRLLLAGLALLILGCFDYTSIMKMEPDGSGTLVFEIGMPFGEADTLEFPEELSRQLDTTSGWQTSTFTVDTVADTVLQVHVEGNFDSPITLTNLSHSYLFDADSFSLTHEDTPKGKRFHLYKCYAKSSDSLVMIENPDSNTSITMELTVTVIESDFEDFDPDAYTWHEELILPGEIIDHNADERKGDILIWERRTWDVFEKGLIMEASWEVTP